MLAVEAGGVRSIGSLLLIGASQGCQSATSRFAISKIAIDRESGGKESAIALAAAMIGAMPAAWPISPRRVP